MATASSVTSTSNLDVNAIVTQLMQVERQPIEKLNLREVSYQAKLSAYGTIKGAISSFESAARSLGSTIQFQSLKATASDSSIFSASATSIAAAGTYNLEVTSLAQAQKLVTAGRATSDTAIGASVTTSLTFDFGTIAGSTLSATTGKYGMAVGGAVTTAGSNEVTVASTDNLKVGAFISGTGIPAGATIASIGAGAVTLSVAATATGSPEDVQITGGTLLNGVATTSGSKDVTVANTDNLVVGAYISGAGIPAGATIASIGAGSITLSVAATATGNPEDVLATGGTLLGGIATASGSKNVTVASTANLAVGAALTGTGIPAGATIASIVDGTTFTLSVAATATGNPADVQAGTTFTSSGSGAKSLSIDSSNNTLQGIRDAINAAKMGITATIVNDGSDTPYRLALSSNKPGMTSSMKITVDGDAQIKALLEHNPGGTQNLAETVTASNANLKVDGVAVSKTSNTVTDVVQGVTLNLLKLSTGPVKLTVARDTAAISTSVAGLVKTYNDLAKTLQDLSAYDQTAKKGAILQGDATVRTMQAQLRSILGTASGEPNAALRTLSDVGVSFQKDGSLTLDQTKLDSAMSDNYSAMAALFTAENGYATRLKNWSTSILASEGALTSRTEGLGRTIADIGRQRSAIEKRLVGIEQNYRRQFTSLDVMLSSMNQTSMYLTQQLAQLSNLN